MNRSLLVSALAASALALGVSSASANIRWVVQGTLSDGATLSGYFNLNSYGYLAGYDLETSAGPTLPAKSYTSGGATTPGGNYVDFTPSGRELRLNFANPLNMPAPLDALLPTSFECQSFACSGPTSPERLIVSGFASAPEPASWTLMLTGFAGIGFATRRRRRAAF